MRILIAEDDMDLNQIIVKKLTAEGYAVANAAPELKAAATGVIGSNREDGVVRWLEKYGRR